MGLSMQRGFLPIPIIIIIGALLLGTSALFISKNFKLSKEPSTPDRGLSDSFGGTLNNDKLPNPLPLKPLNSPLPPSTITPLATKPTIKPSPTPSKISPTSSPSTEIKSISPTSANFGAQITLTGSGFGQAKGGVTFYNQNGGNPYGAPILSWTDTSIRATVPFVAGHQKYQIEVSIANGSRSNRLSFEVLEGQPRIDSFTSSYPGGFITITGQNFGSSQGKVIFDDGSGQKLAECVFLYFATWSDSKIDCGLPSTLESGVEYGLQVITNDNHESSFKYFRTQ